MTTTNEEWELFHVTYGSRLYGTSTPESDTDIKVVYVPSLDSLLLGRKQKIYKTRVDENGVNVPDDSPMPERGVETEFFPLQTFVRDFVNGQTYALEIAFAYLSHHGGCYTSEIDTYNLVKEMVEKFANAEVYSMVGFAMKQTFDYVRRGERLNDARRVMKAISQARLQVSMEMARENGTKEPRLDTDLGDAKVLDYLVAETDLKTSTTTNNNRVLRTLELNGRSYLETSSLDMLAGIVQKLIDSYGERSQDASSRAVDYKSLSHAIRVYQQSIELLDDLTITFPRPNAEYLLRVKQGKEDLESVKSLLRHLDDTVQQKIEESTVRRKTPELIAEAEQWLLIQLHDLYSLGSVQEAAQSFPVSSV